ncbi:MAG: 4-(cytidine 5'-diphospho)-2-C-methyl-D-erythritol kinase [Deltaproteobacteria bacterium]|nr:MAG: 4-(cytidine 5'-diphospho)-2-C-methyl-D-erythritol kinase [Deltaproteobacteria bacterium]
MTLQAREQPTYKTRAPAKLNIRLKITGTRADGYHELVSIMVPITLFDFLEIRKKRSPGIELACEGIQAPGGEKNLVFRAASSFFSRSGVSGGVFIKLAKNIPVAAGMGGGSSDAAATLLLLNDIFEKPLSTKELHTLALELGADVPFFLLCKPCLARGIGEILEPLNHWPSTWYVVITPPAQVSTAWAYANAKLELTKDEYIFIHKKLRDEQIVVSSVLENDLEKVTSARFPIIHEIKELLLEAGAEGALMTGSGPSVFGVFASSKRAHQARERLFPKNLGRVFVATEWRRR